MGGDWLPYLEGAPCEWVGTGCHIRKAYRVSGWHWLGNGGELPEVEEAGGGRGPQHSELCALPLLALSQATSPLILQAPSPLTLSRHPHSPTPAQMENPLYEGLHKEVVNPLFDDADDELEDTRIPVHFQTNLGFDND